MRLSNLFIAACIFMLPLTGWAHGYWIETEGTHKAKKQVTVKMFYGEYAAGERTSGTPLDKMKDITVFVTDTKGVKKQIEMKQGKDYWEGTFVPETDGVYEITGINDVRDVQDWTQHKLGVVRPIQYLKAFYQVGKKAASAGAPLFLDIVTKKISADSFEIGIVKDGAALASQDVTVASFGGEEQILTTDANGKAVVKLAKPALYILSVDWIDKTPGQFREKAYETVRHRLDYSLYQF